MFSQVNKAVLFLLNEHSISFSQWQQAVNLYRAKVKAWLAQNNAPTSVLLFSPCPYEFSVRLFALAQENVNVVLPPNPQPDTLAQLSQFASGFSGTVECPDSLFNIESLVTDNQDALHLDDEIHWPETSTLTFFTSGSSGMAKPIEKHWWQINREVDNLLEHFDMAASHFISTVSHQHIYGLLFKLLVPLKQGACILPQCLFPEDILAQCQQANVQRAILVCSPAFLQRLCRDNVLIDYQQKIAMLLSSGAPLADACAKMIMQQLNVPVTQIYGSTETGGIAHRQVINGNEYWQPFAGITLSHHAHDQRLILQSIYLSEPSRTLDDKGTFNEKGEFTLLGRADRTVKVEDKRVDLEHMESCLRDNAWIQECRLLMLNGQRAQLAAVVTLTTSGVQALEEQGKRHLTQTLKTHLLQQFELVCLPKKWRVVTALPYNSQGKLIASELEALF